MASVLLRSLVMLIGLSVALTTIAYPRRISRNKEYQRRLGQIADKLIDAHADAVDSNEGAKQPPGTSPKRYMEELACLEACYKCVEDYPRTAVSTLTFSSRRNIFNLSAAQTNGRELRSHVRLCGQLFTHVDGAGRTSRHATVLSSSLLRSTAPTVKVRLREAIKAASGERTSTCSTMMFHQ